MEAEEQIDLVGDNDIEDMTDDEDLAEDDGYRAMRDEYREQVPTGNDSYKRTRDEYEEHDPVDDDSYRRVRNEYREQDHDHSFEDEEHDKVSESDAAIDNSGATKHEEKLVESKDEDSEKRIELLSLPHHGSEVFIGGLPRDAAEEDLRELSEPFGEIFEDKEKMESKGFAFNKFTTKDAAQMAIEDIQNKEFRGKTLRCSLSQVKYRLFIGNVPKNQTEEDFRKILDETDPGVENIECFKDAQNPGRNCGFLFAEYYIHECTEYARKKMSSANFNIDCSSPSISWADPKNVADSSAASQLHHLMCFFASVLYNYSMLCNFSPLYTLHSIYYVIIWSSGGHGQIVIYGKGLTPSGMRIVQMVLPDGRIGYVLQQPGAHASPPPPPHSS